MASPEIDVRFTPRSRHSEAHAGLPVLTHKRHSLLCGKASPFGPMSVFRSTNRGANPPKERVAVFGEGRRLGSNPGKFGGPSRGSHWGFLRESWRPTPKEKPYHLLEKENSYHLIFLSSPHVMKVAPRLRSGVRREGGSSRISGR